MKVLAVGAHPGELVLLGPPASGFCDKFQTAAPSRAFAT